MSPKHQRTINGNLPKRPNVPLKASVAIITAIILSSCYGGDGASSYSFDEVFNHSSLTQPKTDNTTTDDTAANDATPEAELTGAQHVLIDATEAGQGKLDTTTREFTARSTADIDARAELAAPDIISKAVPVTISGDNDTDTEQGFKSHSDSATVQSALGELELNYDSVYKDFDDDNVMRIGHIDGPVDVAALGITVPVDGVFVVGNATQEANMPSEGSVEYKGDATYRLTGIDNNIEYGSSVFTADFVATTVDGTLSFDDVDTINLAANIDGNVFSGTNDGYDTEGGFYGGEAEYLGGIYEGNGAQGTYGANKEVTAPPPSTNLTGVQHVRADVRDLGQNTNSVRATTRDFDIRSLDDIDARADLLLPSLITDPVAMQLAGTDDVETENGFQTYEGTANVLADDDLNYVSVYKDFGDDGEMRIAHVDGAVMADTLEVPVDGVAVIGQETTTMPTEGAVDYKGDATYRKVGVGNEVNYGSSALTADFVASTVNGALEFDEVVDIEIAAVIEGNEFSGRKNGYNTTGGFYGTDAEYVGGIYQNNRAQGTFGASKDMGITDPEPPVNPEVPAESDISGVMSNTLSSVQGLGTTNRIGYRQFVTDDQTFTETEPDANGEEGPIITQEGDNFTSYDAFDARLDIVSPSQFTEPQEIITVRDDDVDAGNDFKKSAAMNNVKFQNVNSILGPLELSLDYDSVYRNFDTQMQIGHVYGPISKEGGLGSGVKSRYSNVYAIGNATALADMDYLKSVAQYNVDNDINDGTVQYEGVATYIEKLHLADGDRDGPVVDGTSTFNADFVDGTLEGTLNFAEGDYVHMPEDNEINIAATIDGNEFTSKEDIIATAGGFFGQDAQFLGGIYQEAREEEGALTPGTGTIAGTGTNFQGTFGAEKQ